MASDSDVFTALGRGTMSVLWELGVEPLDERSCEYVNRLTAIATDGLLSLIDVPGLGVERAARSYAAALEGHNELETAALAESIERRASRAT